MYPNKQMKRVVVVVVIQETKINKQWKKKEKLYVCVLATIKITKEEKEN
jgi:hypothetical protein